MAHSPSLGRVEHSQQGNLVKIKFILMERHNEIRDTFAKLMDDICYDVELQPKLQPLEGVLR